MKVREYHMGARADAARLTGERVMDALVALFLEQPLEQIRLADVAERAGVTVQTVIRRFGTKNALVVAAAERMGRKVAAQRGSAEPGDVPAAVANLLDHYEQWGDLPLKLLAEEPSVPEIGSLAEAGRTYHREWCETVFAPTLDRLTGADRRRRLAQLVAICDVYTWKLLRRDAKLSRSQTALALIEMLTPLTQES
jgi:AcrR family transcriptional regulator